MMSMLSPNHNVQLILSNSISLCTAGQGQGPGKKEEEGASEARGRRQQCLGWAGWLERSWQNWNIFRWNGWTELFQRSWQTWIIENSGKKKRRRRLKTDSTEISQYEEVVHSSTNQNSGNVIYEETVPMSESEQVWSKSTEFLIFWLNEGFMALINFPDVPDLGVPWAQRGPWNVQPSSGIRQKFWLKQIGLKRHAKAI